MLAKAITYTDYNGVKRTETFHFHLTKAELMEMELGTTGGMAEMMQRIVEAQDGPAIVKIFKDVILKAYGVKSPDGKQFMKKDPVTGVDYALAFSQTEAYSELFMELSTNAEAGAAFVNGIMPADIAEEAAKQAPNLLPIN